MFGCSECGYKSVKWLGKCPLCEGWETFAQETEEPKGAKKRLKEKSPPKPLRDIEEKDFRRIPTGLDEFDRILGGGLVEGEIILVEIGRASCRERV